MDELVHAFQRIFFVISLFVISTRILAGGLVFNNPYPASDALKNIYYTSFTEQPKTLDPAKAYTNNEYAFIAQIYEPLLQYDYVARPYQLIPLTAAALPRIKYFDAAQQEVVDPDKGTVAYSVYTLSIQHGIFFQPHPAFARDAKGRYRYHALSADYLNEKGIRRLADFKETGTRELHADDYIYQIKRLASPKMDSPIYGLMSDYILGFREYGARLPSAANPLAYTDLRQYPLEGVQKIDDYTFTITIKGHYEPFIFWLAMPFFSPIPWEVDKFYSQPDMDDKNLRLDWYPVGTGPFMLSENNPNSRMVLDKNPRYRVEYDETDRSKKRPFIDKAVYTLEKESIPRWTKFLQGYYDLSGISADSFDQVIQISPTGVPSLTADMQEKGLSLSKMNDLAIYYLGFNMRDPVVGGATERARLLRQAISIAINYEEYIALFYNGRGEAAQGPIPPGIFGYRTGALGINPYVYQWDGSQAKRRPLRDAIELLAKAGYANGIDPSTGQPLILHYDVAARGGPDEKTQLDWMTKQFAQLGISLDVRSTEYNRFQEKMRTGNTQLYTWGWSADYPDPENFLFQLYSKNSKVLFGGENTSNYTNSAYDQLFDLMKNRKNDDERLRLIDAMLARIQYDAPWVWGIHTETFMLSQQWVAPIQWNPIASNSLKYIRINTHRRETLQNRWNAPILWPVAVFFLILCVLLVPFWWAYRRKQNNTAARLHA